MSVDTADKYKQYYKEIVDKNNYPDEQLISSAIYDINAFIDKKGKVNTIESLKWMLYVLEAVMEYYPEKIKNKRMDLLHICSTIFERWETLNKKIDAGSQTDAVSPPGHKKQSDSSQKGSVRTVEDSDRSTVTAQLNIYFKSMGRPLDTCVRIVGHLVGLNQKTLPLEMFEKLKILYDVENEPKQPPNPMQRTILQSLNEIGRRHEGKGFTDTVASEVFKFLIRKLNPDTQNEKSNETPNTYRTRDMFDLLEHVIRRMEWEDIYSQILGKLDSIYKQTFRSRILYHHILRCVAGHKMEDAPGHKRAQHFFENHIINLSRRLRAVKQECTDDERINPIFEDTKILMNTKEDRRQQLQNNINAINGIDTKPTTKNGITAHVENTGLKIKMYALGQVVHVPVTTFKKAGEKGGPLFGGRGLPQMRYIGKNQKEIGFYPGSPDSLGYMYYKWYVLGMRNPKDEKNSQTKEPFRDGDNLYDAKWNDSFSAEMVYEIETYWNKDQLNNKSRFREWYKWHMNYTENVYIARCIETICETYSESIPERIIIPVAISIQKHISDLNRITETRHTREIQIAFANTIQNIINALVKSMMYILKPSNRLTNFVDSNFRSLTSTLWACMVLYTAYQSMAGLYNIFKDTTNAIVLMVKKSSVASRFSAIRLLTDINRMMDGTGEEILGIRRKIIERRVPSKDVDQIQFYLDWALISIQGSILDKYPMRSVEYSSSPLPFYVRVLSNQQHSKEAPDLKMNAIIRALDVYLRLPSVPVLKYWRQVAYCIQEGEWIQKTSKLEDSDVFKSMASITNRIIRCGKQSIFSFQCLFLKQMKAVWDTCTDGKNHENKSTGIRLIILDMVSLMIQSVEGNIIMHLDIYVYPILFDKTEKGRIRNGQCKALDVLLLVLSSARLQSSLLHGNQQMNEFVQRLADTQNWLVSESKLIETLAHASGTPVGVCDDIRNALIRIHKKLKGKNLYYDQGTFMGKQIQDKRATLRKQIQDKRATLRMSRTLARYFV